MIDEKKLIKDLKECLDDTDIQKTLEFFGVYDIINDQPKVGEWIPVSERLPEEGVDVLVWFEYFRYGNYNRLYQTAGISYTYDGMWSKFVNGQSGWNQLSIIAWMPIPEPYKLQ